MTKLSTAQTPHWIGVDLDRTLAHRPRGANHGEIDSIGAPIPAMVARVRRWLEDGLDVRVFTSRVASAYPDAPIQRALVEGWCLEHLGQALPVTAEKDGYMDELWDDLAVSVEENTGRQLSRSSVCLWTVFDFWSGLSDGERAALAASCCTSCGRLDPRCTCTGRPDVVIHESLPLSGL